MITRPFSVFVPAFFAAAVAHCALPDADSDSILLEMEAAAKTSHEKRVAAMAAQRAEAGADVFSRVGVCAFRGSESAPDAWRVEVEAFTTGIGPKTIVEFALITLGSGHGYEALFQTAASARDIKAALDWAGLPAGVPVGASAARFWPRGERVSISVEGEGGGPAESRPVADFVADASSGGSLGDDGGFVYVGGGGEDLDAVGPGSIVSLYNEAFSLFDVPRLAPQESVYESMVSSAAVSTNAFVPVKIVFRPETRAAGKPPLRVRDVSLRLAKSGFLLDGAAGGAMQPVDAMKALCAFRRDCDQDAFVAFRWDGDVPLGFVRSAAGLLEKLENDEKSTGVRVDAPPAGFPYYKSFLPLDEWRDRSKRYSQPCELVFLAGGEDGAPEVKLVRVDEKWEGESLVPEISTEEIPLASPDELPAKLAANSPRGLGALLVFAPSDLVWSAVSPWLDAVRDTHGTVRIFLD